jgi:biopolymer transport protein ExbD
MNFRRGFASQGDSFQIAPLIDIVFLLLVFFIVTGALAAQERETLIQLPKTTSAVARPREKFDIVVNITREGQIWINNRRYSVANLQRVLADIQRSARPVAVSVIVRADGATQYENVAKVLDACAAVKIKRVSFVSLGADRRAAP